jgi:ATP-dependent Lon protease
MVPNIYEHLHNLHDDVVNDPGTTNERRKAEKKLKEIQTLIKKTSHTKEELDKLATEQHWKDIIDWFDNPKKTAETKPEETQKTIKNRLKRKREKEKRERQLEEILKQRRRREKEAEEQKRRHEEYRKQRQEEEFRKQEQKRQEEEEFRKQEQTRQEEEFRKHHYKHQYLWSEFEALYRQNNDVNKTFRKLSVKYHPDKNIGKQEWAEAKQKELTNIRDHYSNGLHLMGV